MSEKNKSELESELQTLDSRITVLSAPRTELEQLETRRAQARRELEEIEVSQQRQTVLSDAMTAAAAAAKTYSQYMALRRELNDAIAIRANALVNLASEFREKQTAFFTSLHDVNPSLQANRVFNVDQAESRESVLTLLRGAGLSPDTIKAAMTETIGVESEEFEQAIRIAETTEADRRFLLAPPRSIDQWKTGGQKAA